MNTDFTHQYLNLIEEVAQDGELTHKEIYQLAKWLNDNKEGRKSWPANQFLPLLKDVFADGRIDKSEAQQVGRLIQTVRREWAREHSLGTGSEPAKYATAKFDDEQPILPSIGMSLSVASFNEPNLIYQVDFAQPSCSCPDFKSSRQHLPVGHISRCCKHIMQGYSKIRTSTGWPSWLDVFLEAGFRPHPKQEWTVCKSVDGNFLVSSANPEWGNAYARINDEAVKYGYNVIEDRWSYGYKPDDANTISNAIRRLSNC